MPPKKRPKSANTSTTARGNNERPARPKKTPKGAQSPTQSSSSGRRSSTATSSSSSSTPLFPTTATTGSSLQEDAKEEEATFGDMTDASLAADGVLVEISVDDELERATTTAVVGGDEDTTNNTSSTVDNDVVVVVDNDVMFIKHVPRMRQPTVLTPLTPSTTTIPSLIDLTRAGLNPGGYTESLFVAKTSKESGAYSHHETPTGLRIAPKCSDGTFGIDQLVLLVQRRNKKEITSVVKLMPRLACSRMVLLHFIFINMLVQTRVHAHVIFVVQTRNMCAQVAQFHLARARATYFRCALHRQGSRWQLVRLRPLLKRKK